MRLIFMVIVLAVINGISYNIYGAYQYNKIPVGGRAAALGGNILSIYDDYSVYENPAQLVYSSSDYVSFGYNSLLEDMTASSFLFHKNMKRFNISGGVSNFTINDIPLYPDYPTEDPIGHFDTHHITAIVGAGFRVSKDKTLGISARYLLQKLYETHSQAVSFDIGFTYEIPLITGLKFAAAVNHLGLSKKIDNNELKLPMSYGYGLSYQIPILQEHSILFAYNNKIISDIDENPNDKKETLHNFSSEVKLFQRLAVLFSYHTANDLYENLSYGFQIEWKSFSFYYGNITTTEDLNSNQFITVTKFF